LEQLISLNKKFIASICTAQEKAVKVRLKHKGKDYVLDYNFNEPDNVFILTRKGGKLFVKDCNLASIPETLGSF
jgi:hypothetical protein